MTNFLLKRILIFFDYFHKKKIIDNLKDLDFNNNLKIILDVGAHEGESIELFLKNLKVDNIYSFEPSEETFKKLLKNSKKLIKKFKKTNIILENLAIGKANQKVNLNYLNETSSSTIRNINTNSDYFKKRKIFW